MNWGSFQDQVTNSPMKKGCLIFNELVNVSQNYDKPLTNDKIL